MSGPDRLEQLLKHRPEHLGLQPPARTLHKAVTPTSSPIRPDRDSPPLVTPPPPGGELLRRCRPNPPPIAQAGAASSPARPAGSLTAAVRAISGGSRFGRARSDKRRL